MRGYKRLLNITLFTLKLSETTTKSNTNIFNLTTLMRCFILRSNLIMIVHGGGCDSTWWVFCVMIVHGGRIDDDSQSLALPGSRQGQHNRFVRI